MLLTDTSETDDHSEHLGSDGLAYGYFFVDGDVTVYIETRSVEIGADNLRTLADEAHARLTGG